MPIKIGTGGILDRARMAPLQRMGRRRALTEWLHASKAGVAGMNGSNPAKKEGDCPPLPC